jgi:hypothetical protein
MAVAENRRLTELVNRKKNDEEKRNIHVTITMFFKTEQRRK